MLDGASVGFKAPLHVFRMDALEPTLPQLRLELAARELQPCRIDVVTLTIGVRGPNKRRSRVRQQAKTLFALPQLRLCLPSLGDVHRHTYHAHGFATLCVLELASRADPTCFPVPSYQPELGHIGPTFLAAFRYCLFNLLVIFGMDELEEIISLRGHTLRHDSKHRLQVPEPPATSSHDVLVPTHRLSDLHRQSELVVGRGKLSFRPPSPNALRQQCRDQQRFRQNDPNHSQQPPPVRLPHRRTVIDNYAAGRELSVLQTPALQCCPIEGEAVPCNLAWNV